MEVAHRAQAAGHGRMGAVYEEASRTLGIPLGTLHRQLAQVSAKAPRKRRSDAGVPCLSLPDAQLLSAHLMEGFRANNKHILPVREALVRLRANHPRFAQFIDAETGEVRPLSESACINALRTYRLHPAQLRLPAPAQALASDHPNHVWQLDFSISTLYYVPDEGGAQDMAPGEFNKNKPKNFERIKRQRLLRGAITDHTSGAIFVMYLRGGESVANMAALFLAAVQQRPGHQMYGVPFMLMVDPGSGAGGAFVNLLRRLDVKLIVNKPGNPRAKGQVENAHNLIETSFESGFKFTHVPGIDWINEKAALWMRYYNSAHEHSRHGLTRWQKWMQIKPEQLRVVDAALARQLLTREPETPKVSIGLTVRFAASVWDVRDVPGVMAGQKLSITFNPFDPSTAYVVERDADGHETLIAVPQVQHDEHGFAVGAARIGETFKAMPDTLAQTNRKLIERIATGAQTDGEAEQARKAKQLPFGGTFDPYKHHADLPAVATLPRRGTVLEPAAQVHAPAPRLLTHFEVGRALTERHGLVMDAARYAQLRAWWPDGLAETDLDAAAQRLDVRAGLRVVAGGA